MHHTEKAKELYEKFYYSLPGIAMRPEILDACAKSCARNCVEEIIDAVQCATGHLELKTNDIIENKSDIQFWRDVKKSIEKI